MSSADEAAKEATVSSSNEAEEATKEAATSPTVKAMKKEHLPQPSLSTLETAVCAVVQVAGAAYCLYKVHLASKAYTPQLETELDDSGRFLGRRKDISDQDWETYSELAADSIPWVVAHFVGAQFLRRFFGKEKLPAFYLALGCAYCGWLLGLRGLLLLLLQPIMMFSMIRIVRSSVLVYLVSLAFIAGSQYDVFAEAEDWALPPDTDDDVDKKWYITRVVLFWTNSRAMSYCLDAVWGEVSPTGNALADLTRMLAYCFYLPCCVEGPLVNYREFEEGFLSGQTPSFLSTARLLIRYGMWFFLNDLILHLIYFSAVKHNPDILEKLNLWALVGVGYSVGQFFYLKALLRYGIGRTFLLSDGVVGAPSQPKCISRIHLYSDMWRHIDNGHYKFLLKYFYLPVLGKIGGGRRSVAAKLAASAATFAFMFLWHGMGRAILIWTAWNFVAIALEAVAKAIGSTEVYQNTEGSLLGPRGRRRLHALLAAPLLAFCLTSNMFFLAGADVGAVFFRRFLFPSSPSTAAAVLLFMYCAAQTSVEAKNWEIRRRKLRH